MDYAIFFRAEPANPGLVEDEGGRTHTVGYAEGGRGYNHAHSIHRVTALTAVGDVVRQRRVKQASSRAERSACRASLHATTRPKARQIGRISDCRIRRQISHFGSVDGTNRAH